MYCDGCGQKLTVTNDFDYDKDRNYVYLVCPNFESAFQDFIHMEQQYLSNPQLGTYPCERVYEIPIHYEYL